MLQFLRYVFYLMYQVSGNFKEIKHEVSGASIVAPSLLVGWSNDEKRKLLAITVYHYRHHFCSVWSFVLVRVLSWKIARE